MTERNLKGALVHEIPETHRDLLDAQFTSLSTIGDDGYPQVTMILFLNDDDGKLKLSLNTSRTKTRNLRQRPECALLILDPENPHRYLEIRARAHVEPDPDYEFADYFMERKYGGGDLRKMDRPGESRVKVTLEPVGVWAVKLR